MKSAKSWTRDDWMNMTLDDWMNMTLSDWIDATPSDWLDRSMPGWRERSYGDLLRTRPSEWWNMFYAPFMQQTPASGTRPRGPHRHECRCGCHDTEGRHKRHDHGSDCGRCGPDDCECFCCLGDVDLAVYARVGEVRVLPIVVENERRRERAVTLELSNWTTRGGATGAVETVALEPRGFTLAPCGQQQVTLVVGVHPPARPTPNTGPGAEPGRPADDVQPGADRRPPADVDRCEVVTADLRLVGCDHRPIRIAIAIVPRDCDPFRVSCGCACC